MAFLLTESLKNLVRHRRRYLPLGILLFFCALLSGAMLTLAAAAKQYLANHPLPDALDAVLSAQRTNLLALDSRASLAEAGILLVSAAALFYVSSLAVNERIGDTGILCALGVSKSTVLGGMLTELAVLSALTLLPGCILGKAFAVFRLRTQVQSELLPKEILAFLSGGTQTALLILSAAVLLLLPLGILTVKTAQSDPISLLSERK
ncbi:MAG: FtsX-like permease family protein [Clostridia bacterium]|nr:FtsX-like permease family protein [Clostridia bacterium]